MKIYTKTGDDGTTGLLGGTRVLKSDPRIRCCGGLDELNDVLGLAAAAESAPVEMLRRIQGELFAVGSHLAVPEGTAVPAYLPALEDAMIQRLEKEIDAAEADLPPLKLFILPGGSEAAARLHLARSVCRRAERDLVDFMQGHVVPKLILLYLNRLSDWLFVQARAANQRAGVADIPWHAK